MVRRAAALLVLRVEMIRIAREARAEAGHPEVGGLLGMMLGGSMARGSQRRRRSSVAATALQQYLNCPPAGSSATGGSAAGGSATAGSGGVASGVSHAPLLSRIDEVAGAVMSSQASIQKMSARLDGFETSVSHVNANVLSLKRDMQKLLAHHQGDGTPTRSRPTRRTVSGFVSHLKHPAVAVGVADGGPAASTSRTVLSKLFVAAPAAGSPPSERPAEGRHEAMLQAARWLGATSSAHLDGEGEDALWEGVTDLDDGVPLV
jgi:hypothetical protein